MYGSSFLFDRFFISLASCVCGPGIGFSFHLSYSQGPSYIFFCCGKGGAGGYGFYLYSNFTFSTFPRYFDYFPIIYGKRLVVKSSVRFCVILRFMCSRMFCTGFFSFVFSLHGSQFDYNIILEAFSNLVFPECDRTF